jgi:hypothetical protein
MGVHMKKKPFTLPKAFVNQLKEFTNGFYLVTLDENFNFSSIPYYPSEAAEHALVNFMDIQSSLFQEAIRQRALGESGLQDGDEEEV